VNWGVGRLWSTQELSKYLKVRVGVSTLPSSYKGTFVWWWFVEAAESFGAECGIRQLRSTAKYTCRPVCLCRENHGSQHRSTGLVSLVLVVVLVLVVASVVLVLLCISIAVANIKLTVTVREICLINTILVCRMAHSGHNACKCKNIA